MRQASTTTNPKQRINPAVKKQNKKDRLIALPKEESAYNIVLKNFSIIFHIPIEKPRPTPRKHTHVRPRAHSISRCLLESLSKIFPAKQLATNLRNISLNVVK